MVTKTIIATANAPQAIGPYSQAVQVGNWLYLSGQIPLVPATGELVTASFEAQVVQIFQNIAAILAAAGADFGHVVKTTVFLKNLDDFAEMNRLYAQYFPTNPPARSTIQVAKLPKDVPLEIEMIACFGA